jgi:hypothetical protein
VIPKNARGKNFSWSPSAIADYVTCPAQYGAKRFYETIPYVETEAMRAGTAEHKALELRLQGKPLPASYARGEKYCRVIETCAAGGQIFTEKQLAINRDMKFVKWFAKDAYGRCQIDVLALKGKNCFVGDWKTGGIRENSLQLKINACFVSQLYPDLDQFNLRYIWLKHDAATGEVFKKEQIPSLWEEIFAWIRRMEDSWEREAFAPKPSGLCRAYCSATACPHCGKGGRR